MANTEWKYLQPEKLTIDPNSYLAEEKWKFWLKTFTNFVEALLTGENTLNKFKVLTAHLSAPIYKLISEETTYESAIIALHNLFVKPKNEIYARHMLQDTGESVDEFILRITKLSQNFDFTGVSDQEYKDNMKRDSFTNGLSSNFIRQRLLENRTLTFIKAHEKARSIELAKLNCETYVCQDTSSRQMCALQKDETKSKENNVSVIASKKQFRNFTCYICGESKWHLRSRCPAKNKICDSFEKAGHYAKCCLKRKNSSNCVDQPYLASTTALRSTFSQHV